MLASDIMTRTLVTVKATTPKGTDERTLRFSRR